MTKSAQNKTEIQVIVSPSNVDMLSEKSKLHSAVCQSNQKSRVSNSKINEINQSLTLLSIESKKMPKLEKVENFDTFELQKPGSKTLQESQKELEAIPISNQEEEKKDFESLNDAEAEIAPQTNFEPSFIREFRESSSQYVLPYKENSEAISSNGEFADANNAIILEEQEDQTEIVLCEIRNLWKQQVGQIGSEPPA